MIGTYLNTLAILVGTGIGCLLHGGIKPRYQEALYLAIGLAAPVLFCWQRGFTWWLSTCRRAFLVPVLSPRFQSSVAF